jgi:PAS domain S-box-containing protein
MEEQTSTSGLGWDRAVLKSVANKALMPLAFLDIEFNYIHVNPAYAEGLGHDAADLAGRSHLSLFPLGDMGSHFEMARRTGEPLWLRAVPLVSGRDTDEETKYWDLTLTPVKDEQGAVCGFVLVSTDVTELVVSGRASEDVCAGLWKRVRRMEETAVEETVALFDSEERFRAIFDDLVIGIALLDVDGRLVASNRALQIMFQCSEEALEGTFLTSYVHPLDVETSEELLGTLVSGEVSYYQIDTRYVRGDGLVRWAELTVSRRRVVPGNAPWFAMATLGDITEKKEIQESLVRAERLSIAGRLGVSLAHEINNPLQSVIGCLGLAEEMLEDSDEVRRYLEIAIEELERAAGIVRQLRGLGRTSKYEERELCDVNALVERVMVLTRKRCQNRRVSVVWNPAPDLPRVSLAPDRIQQVFLNLVLNAVEAMPEGGVLTMSTGAVAEQSELYICFADTGIGILPENLTRIFEPFHSIRPESLGLGLYISKTIVEEHNGRIEVETRVGEGSMFTVWVPC